MLALTLPCIEYLHCVVYLCQLLTSITQANASCSTVELHSEGALSEFQLGQYCG
jgi:hypothetical protein